MIEAQSAERHLERRPPHLVAGSLHEDVDRPAARLEPGEQRLAVARRDDVADVRLRPPAGGLDGDGLVEARPRCG